LSKVGEYCSFQIQQFCVKNAKCRNNICECLLPYELIPDGLCELGHGQACKSSAYKKQSDDDKICLGKLVCSVFPIRGDWDSETSCPCPNPRVQKYDEYTRSCRSRVGVLCDKDEETSCAKRSSCVEEVEGDFRCVCDKGFIVNDRFLNAR